MLHASHGVDKYKYRIVSFLLVGRKTEMHAQMGSKFVWDFIYTKEKLEIFPNDNGDLYPWEEKISG